MSDSDIQAFRRASKFEGAGLRKVNDLFDEYRFGGGRASSSIRAGNVVAEGPLFSELEGHYIVVSDGREVRRYFGSRVDLSSWMRYAESEKHVPSLDVLATRVEKIGESRSLFHHSGAQCWLGPCHLEYSGEAEELRAYVIGNPEPIDVRDVPPTRFREAAQKKYSADPSGWVEEALPSSFLVGARDEPAFPRSVVLREPPPSTFLTSKAMGDERRWYVRAYSGTASLDEIAMMLREYGAHRVSTGVDFLMFFARPSSAYEIKHKLEASPRVRDIDIQMVTRQEQAEPEEADDKEDEEEESPKIGSDETQVDPSTSDVPGAEDQSEEEVSLIGEKIRFLTNDGDIMAGTVTDEDSDTLIVRSETGEIEEINVDQLLGDGVDLTSDEEEEEKPEDEGEDEEDEPGSGEEDIETGMENLEGLIADAELMLIEIEEAVTGGYSSRHSHDAAGSVFARKAGSDAMKAASPGTGPGSREKCPEGHKKDEVTGLCVPTQEDLTTGMIATYDRPMGPVIRAPFPQKRKKHDDDED